MPEPDDALMRRLAARARLAGNGGGGDDGNAMERRVASLEADMRDVKVSLARIERLLERLDDRMRKVELELAEVKGRVAQVPTSWTLFTAILGTVITVTGLTFAVVRFAGQG